MKKTVIVIAGCLLFIQGVFAQTVVFEADFDASTEVSGVVTANASASNLDAGTSIGSWTLPGVNPGAIISDGGSDNAFVFDKATSGSTSSNSANAVFSRSVNLAAGEDLTVEMDLYAVRQGGGQKVSFSLDDANGDRACLVVFQMDNDKFIYTVDTSGSSFLVATNAVESAVNTSYNNPAVDDYLTWGSGTMIHVKIEVSGGYTTPGGNTGAKLSIDWNGDGDYADNSELLEVDFGPRTTGIAEISSLRIANFDTVNGGAWIDNISVTAEVGEGVEVSSHDFYFNLAKYQSVTADSYASDKPVQFANDGFVSQDNRWVSEGAGPHWLEIELAVPMTIGSAHLFSGGTWNSAMADIVLQYDDGGSWTDIGGTDVSGNTLPELNLTFTAPVTARKFRLYTTDGTARVKELALYPPTLDGSNVAFGVDVDLNIAKLRQYEYSSVDGANYPRLAIDGYADNSSAWASTNAAGPHDLEIHLPQGEKIRGIQLYSGWEGQAGTQIQNFEVAYDDGGWVPFAGGTITGNANLETNVYFNASATTTKIRFRSLGAGQAVIRELVVLPENDTGGYPLWTDVLDEAPPSQSFMDYEDSYYTIENRDAGQFLSTSTNGSSITTNEPWFQVLQNLGTDTYRLRSKDSERCFEVSLASTNGGASIVEGTYSSMPHQRWRLEDTGDGTHFRIVNVWSGLVLDLDGTNVVQQVADADHTQHWKINYQTHYPKKGQAAHPHFNYMFKPAWSYNWGFGGEDNFEYGQYMPMQWGGIASSTAGILREQPKWYGRAGLTMVMGFNEPDNTGQANMTEETAAYQWPRLERMRLPLLGPGPDHYKGTWRQNYEAMAAERGLRSEYMAMHRYSPDGAKFGSPSTLINNMKENLYDVYGKPICLTEFSTRDFAGDKTTWSRNHNYNFLAEFMWRAETLPWLKRWSLFEWGYGGGANDDPATDDSNSENPTDMNSPRLALHYKNDSSDPGWEDLMECGLLLAGWDGNTNTVDNTAYIIHNKGRFLRLIDHPASNTVSYADVEHRQATEQFMLEAAPGGNKYITGLSDGRRLSCNGSSVGLAAKGTMGSTVEWELTENQYGWFYIDHPSTGKRLRITNSNVIDVANDTNAGDNLMFRFIKHYLPITLTEVQTLPYFESFEDGIGAWRQFYDDPADWEVGSGGTPTATAGPSGASDGDFYLFSEGHDSPSQTDNTNMVECVFDLSTVASTVMTFDYHMYGTYIDFLAIDIHDGATWTSDVWIRTNQQHTSSADPWSTAAVDLTGYTGNDKVTIRFRTANDHWNAADPAIDNIRIEQGAQVLPYAESFESGYGAWIQSVDDDFDWTRNSGYTDTTNTGPSGASNGSWYLYVEGHDIGESNKTASIECAFDLSTAVYPELIFDYHMYGEYIDFLSVDVYDGAAWTSNLWTQSGQQHTSSAAVWSNAVVDLTAFAGNDGVTIRFRARQGEWHAADTAIDHILVQEHDFTPYELWALDAFSGAPPGTDTGAMGNPDGDSNYNELEWILATDPLVADTPITAIWFEGPSWYITYTRRKIADTSVYAEYSPELVSPSWGIEGILYEGVIIDDGEIETVAVILSYDLDVKFIRLRVVQ